MRLWSLHPKYLDTKGLLAVWRESLLARKVLEGKTKGYQKHPQLTRFRMSADPISAINIFLQAIYDESCKRGYCFDNSKVQKTNPISLPVTSGQIDYEANHLKNKLFRRSPKDVDTLKEVKILELTPLFFLVEGEVESWEKVL